MKPVKCFEDHRGILHKTKESCMVSDAEHSFTTLVEQCTAFNNIFAIDEFLSAIRSDAALAKEISILFDIKAEPAKDAPAITTVETVGSTEEAVIAPTVDRSLPF